MTWLKQSLKHNSQVRDVEPPKKILGKDKRLEAEAKAETETVDTDLKSGVFGLRPFG